MCFPCVIALTFDGQGLCYAKYGPQTGAGPSTVGREHLPYPTPPTVATFRGGGVISSENWWKQVFKTLQQFVIAETSEHVIRGLPLLNRVQTSLGVVGSGW